MSLKSIFGKRPNQSILIARTNEKTAIQLLWRNDEYCGSYKQDNTRGWNKLYTDYEIIGQGSHGTILPGVATRYVRGTEHALKCSSLGYEIPTLDRPHVFHTPTPCSVDLLADNFQVVALEHLT